VAAMSTNGTSSDLYNQNKCDLSVSECLNCVLLKKQLCSASEEAESAKLIIKLLQKESDEDYPHDDRISEAINSPSDMSAIVYSNGLENNKWTVTTAKCHRKGFSPKNLNEMNNTFPLSIAKRYEQLINLQDMLENDTTLMIQGETNT
jgi:type IV secretory pathway ATPase VirB11/archaellum biosynthesis ATPase